ncbi:MAG: hypothetical protein ACXW3Z_13955 [Limisphaerales bacterium]
MVPALLAGKLAANKPTLSLILTSGLTEDNIDLPPAHARFVRYPFSIAQLRQVIEVSS